MKRSWNWALGAAGLAAVIALAGWKRGWFVDEPVRNGRTVTGWLDRMTLFDAPRNANPNNGYQLPSNPAEIRKDPSLVALLTLGPVIVPTLEKRIKEGPRAAAGGGGSRAPNWFQQLWDQLEGSSAAPAGRFPGNYDTRETARKMAASLMMLALGTNGGAGTLRLLEDSAQAPGAGFWLQDAFWVAEKGLPERRAEIVAALTAGLSHSNAVCRSLAAGYASVFRDNMPVWKSKLMELARRDPDEGVRLNALWAFVLAGPADNEVLQLSQEIIADANNPEILRFRAIGVLEIAGTNSLNALPLLQEIDAGAARGSNLKKAAERAIQQIEAAAARGQRTK